MLSPENRDRADLKALLERVKKAEGADGAALLTALIEQEATAQAS